MINIWKWVEKAATLGSILGVIVLIFAGDEIKSSIALGAVIVFLIAVFLKLHSGINRFVAQKYPLGYSSISTVVAYSTQDGNLIQFDCYRTIQCKMISMKEYRYHYGWSGSEQPQISSLVQDVDGPYKTPLDEPDYVILRFKKWLSYNDTEIIHVSMRINDADRKSEPYLATPLKDPTKQIHWRIELRHAPATYNKCAKVTRRRIDEDGKNTGSTQLITSIPFDTVSKTYDHIFQNPEPGYVYRIDWEKVEG